MQFDIGATRIFHCPVCEVDTPHTVKAKKGDMYGIICTNCLGGAVVSGLDLRIYQLKWEGGTAGYLGQSGGTSAQGR